MIEFSRRVAMADLGNAAIERRITAGPQERAALAERFGLRALDRLEAQLSVRRTAEGAEVSGRLVAQVVQACVVSGADVAAAIDEPLALRFSRHAEPGNDEHELRPEELDLMLVEDGTIDLGEAVAQTLAVALDPYPRASEAELKEARRRLLSEEEAAAARDAERRKASPFRVIEGGGER